MTGNHGAVNLKTFAHGGDQGQGRGGGTTGNAGAHHITTIHTQRGAIHISTGRSLDAISDIGTNILVEVGRRNDYGSAQERLRSSVLTGTVRLGVVGQLVVGAQSLVAQVHITDSLLGNPAGTEDHAHGATNGLVGVARLNAIGVLELHGFFFVPVTKNVGVVARIDLGNVELVRVDRHC